MAKYIIWRENLLAFTEEGFNLEGCIHGLNGGGEPISLWLYKENNKLRD
jgi:hypothetical protein